MQDQATKLVDAAISETQQDYLSNPANFRIEQHITEDIARRLNNILAPVTIDHVRVEEDHGSRGDTTNHEQYTRNYQKLDRVQAAITEASSYDFSFEGTGNQPPRIDIGVFRMDRTVIVDNGTQLCEPEDLRAAIGVKYLKNKNFLRYSDEMEGKYGEIIRDIERIGQIDGQLDRHYLLATNYGVFRNNLDAKEGLKEAAEQNEVSLHFAIPEPISE
jgi:hypothetical protein